MPRTIRYIEPGTVYHLIARFVAEEWFIRDEQDRQHYLRLLGHALSDSDWKCLAYAIMSNHIHLALIAGATPMAEWLRRVHSPFAEFVNREHARIGPVFVRGPRDRAVDPSGVGRVIAYIHNNPVRAGVIDRARAGRWTSHAAYVGLAAPPEWLFVREGLERSGFEDADAFERWVDTAPAEREDVDLRTVQRAVRARGAIALGTPILNVPDVGVAVPLLARQSTHLRIDPMLVVQATADEVGIPALELCSRRRSRDVVFARRVAVMSALQLGLTGVDIGAALAISNQATSAIWHGGFQTDAAVQQVCERVFRRLAPIPEDAAA